MKTLSLSAVIITLNEETNLARTLASVVWADEIVVVDSGSTDRTREVAESFRAKFYIEAWKGFAAQKNSALARATGDWILSLDADEEVEPALADEIVVVDSGSTDRTREVAESFQAKFYIEAWKGFAAQKNSALARASGEWILSLDADEEVEPALADEIRSVLAANPSVAGFWIPRKNFFLGRWMKHGGFYPDPKLRLFRRGAGQFEDRLVHEDLHLDGPTTRLQHHLLHRAYPTLDAYLEHMNRYSSLGAQMAGEKRARGFSFIDIVVRPKLTFFYNYVLRLGFLDGREGLLLHLYHAGYVSWKYAKAWEIGRRRNE